MFDCDFFVKLLIELIILKSSFASDLPCGFHDSTDITSGDHHPNGSITHNGVEYRHGDYAEVNYTIKDGEQINMNHTRGCLCAHRACLRLCCPYGTYAITKGKTSVIEKCVANEKAKHFELNVTNENGEEKTINEFEIFAYVEKEFCNNSDKITKFKIFKVNFRL